MKEKEMLMMDYRIIDLPKEQWKGTLLPIPDTREKLYEDDCEHAFAWGVLDKGKLVAAIETDGKLIENQLRIIWLCVDTDYCKKGIGHELIQVAKEQARQERCKTIVVETVSSNVTEIEFYQKEGFTMIKMDSAYDKENTSDQEKVRLEFDCYGKRKPRVSRENIIIREETKADYYETELMTMRAFWNKHFVGCNEHYLVHQLRLSKDYVAEVSRIAVKDGKIIGCILYSKAKVIDGEKTHEVLTFGPLCVDPDWQGAGVGEILLKETMQLVKKQGYRGIIIYGEPEYYPRVGFKTCDHYGITTPDGANFDAFMGIELIKDGLKNIKGKFYESDVFDTLAQEKVELYNNNFPSMRKLKYPFQWQ